MIPSAIITDVGIFASFDHVTLDMACVDAYNKQSVMHGSKKKKKDHLSHDHVINTHPETTWEVCIDHSVKIGIGNKEYELIEV